MGRYWSNSWACFNYFTLGALGSLLIMQGIALVTQQIIVEQTGVLLGGMSPQLVDLWVFGGVVSLGCCEAVVRTKCLSHESCE